MLKIGHSGRLLVRYSRDSALFPALKDFRALEEPLGYTLQPLLHQDDATSGQRLAPLQRRGAYENGWSIAAPTHGTRIRLRAWELTHNYRRSAARQAGIQDASIGVYAEPDLFQTWEPYALHDARSGPDDFDANWPTPTATLARQRDSQHAQLADAAANANNGLGVRISILDTGYDPKHRVQARGITRTKCANR
jgi:hypothetical protein